jgi:hypothetical protein
VTTHDGFFFSEISLEVVLGLYKEFDFVQYTETFCSINTHKVLTFLSIIHGQFGEKFYLFTMSFRRII